MPRDRRDPIRTLDLLWGTAAGGTRGPKPGLTVNRIVEAAIKVADAEGLAAVSMRRVAQDLGFTTMSLYRYVPSKDELLELMLEVMAADQIPAADDTVDWRTGLATWARRTIQMYRAHPWIIEVPLNSPPMGPNMVTWMERGLAPMSDTPLTGGDMIQTLMLLTGFTRGHAQVALSLSQAEVRTGVPEQDWNAVYEQMLGRVVQEGKHPTLTRLVMSDAFDAEDDDAWLDADFEFGLERILDGVAALIAARGAGAD